MIGIAGCTDSGATNSGNNEGGDSGGSSSNFNSNPTPTERPDSDGDGIPDTRDDYPYDSDLSQDIGSNSDTRKIEEDEWLRYNFEFNSRGKLYYDFIVRSGPSIDVIVMEQSEYSSFRSDERSKYIPSLSALDSSGTTIESKVSRGDYYVIFDNSTQGRASPPSNFSNDVATVEFEIRLAE